MRRLCVGLATTTLALLALAAPSAAEETYVCIITNSETNQGYCVTVWYPNKP
jgi:hypothetical protein